MIVLLTRAVAMRTRRLPRSAVVETPRRLATGGPGGPVEGARFGARPQVGPCVARGALTYRGDSVPEP